MSRLPMKPDTPKQSQTRPGRPGVDDPRKSDPSRQASRLEPSHQKNGRADDKRPADGKD